jgi:hypothetical protein
VVGSCEHGNEPSGSIKGGEFLRLAEHTISFSRRTLVHGVSRLRNGIELITKHFQSC